MARAGCSSGSPPERAATLGRVSEHPTAASFVPPGADLEGLRVAARDCRGCPLYRDATQTVFSRGAADARVVLVGEQPGDVEDRRGEPFVGPAGRLLDRALAEAGIAPETTYTTNAVKHFKFTYQQGKRRIHATPDRAEVLACRPWLEAELALLAPEVVVTLGATAGQALLGPGFRVTRARGTLIGWPDDEGAVEDGAPHSGFLLPTIHPSAVLRANDRDAAYAGLVADLAVAAKVLAG